MPTSRETSVPISSEPTLGGSSAAGGSASFCDPFGVGPREVERDRAAAHGDAALERARRRILQAGRRAVDHAVDRLGGRAVHLEQALEREAHVGGPHALAVRVADAAPQRERPGASPVGRARQLHGEIRDHAVGRRARGLAECSQAVLRDLEQLPVLLGRIHLRIGRAAVGGRECHERAAAMACSSRDDGQREQPREDGEHAAADR